MIDKSILAQIIDAKSGRVKIGRIAQPADGRPYKCKTDIQEKIKELLKNGGGVLQKVKVTSDVAADLLDLNISNRPFFFYTIDAYASEMMVGQWDYTGEGYVVSSTGSLLDGQKRNWALLTANMELEKKGKDPVFIIVDIIVGPDDKVKSKLNVHKPRAAQDILSDNGYDKQRNHLAAAIKTIWYLLTYNRVGSTMKRGVTMSNNKVQEWLNRKRNMELLVQFTDEAPKLRAEGGFFTITTYVAIWYILHKIDADKAREFITKLAYGKELTSGVMDENIYHLRQTLQSIHNRRGKLEGAYKIDERYRYVFRVWNASLERKRVGKKIEIDTESPEIEMPHR